MYEHYLKSLNVYEQYLKSLSKKFFLPYIDIKKVIQCYKFMLLWQQNRHTVFALPKNTLFSKTIYI